MYEPLKTYPKIFLFLMIGFFSSLSLANTLMPQSMSDLKCPPQSVLNKKTGFCKRKDEIFCPINQILNSSSTACVKSCSTNKKPYDGQCLHVCTGDKIQGIGGLVCPDGKPGLSMENYKKLIK